MRLNKHQRHSARNNILLGAHLMLSHPGAIYYTQGADRWEGIARRDRVVKGHYPRHGDCSSTVTWMLWNALTHALEDMAIGDIVNGLHWQAGNTETMMQHGKHISRCTIVGDCVFYGHTFARRHVAIYIGNGYVFSHGSAGGPYKVNGRYRSDIVARRRYILAPYINVGGIASVISGV